MAVPQNYKFTKTHEWVKVDGDVATIGITDFAQGELGDITYLELPGVGAEVRQSEPFGVVESVKAASDVYAPVTGEVTEANQALSDDPSLVNTDPEGEGWFFRLRLADTSELDGLMDADAYKSFCESQ